MGIMIGGTIIPISIRDYPNVHGPKWPKGAQPRLRLRPAKRPGSGHAKLRAARVLVSGLDLGPLPDLGLRVQVLKWLVRRAGGLGGRGGGVRVLTSRAPDLPPAALSAAGTWDSFGLWALENAWLLS